MAEENWAGEIGKEIERIFRYLLPGITVVGIAGLSHPAWFLRFHPETSQHLVLLAAVALCVGRSWYVAHRYSLHQIVDWLSYALTKKGQTKNYHDWLAEHISKSSRGKAKDMDLRHNIGLRSAQVIYMFILGESLALFSWMCPEQGTFFCAHRCFLLYLSLGILIFAALQQWLLFEIDSYAVENPNKDDSRT